MFGKNSNSVDDPESKYRGSIARAIVSQLSIHLVLFLFSIIVAVLSVTFSRTGQLFSDDGRLFMRLALLIAAGCLAGCATIMFGLIRRIVVAPLREFSDAIEMIRHGAKNFPLLDSRTDEIGRLARVFRSMMTSIKDRDDMLQEQNRLLERKIESATSDLRVALKESQRSQSILFGQQMILSRIATNAPLDESFDLIVAVFQGIVPDCVCAVLLLDVEKKVLRATSFTATICQFTHVLDGLSVGDAGAICGKAAETGTFQSSRDLAADPAEERFKKAARDNGIASGWSQPILSRSGQVLGTFNVFYSASKEPESEEVKFADMLADLAGIAIERARTERDLISARDEAQHAVRAKTDFLANMSHEIRTPMNGIMGLTDLALDLQLDAEPRSYIEMIKESSQSLMEIINDVLDFSKAEAHRMEIDAQEINLHQFIERTLSILSVRARQKSLVFVSKVEKRVPQFVRGDVTRIGQILNNLVVNAIKFTNRHGAVVIYVDGEVGENNTVNLKCAVTDTGIGIPADKQSAIFDAFTQADTSMTRRFGGTGLGLAICRQLVQLMGGDIHVRSNVQIGTAFHFNLILEQSSEKLLATDEMLRTIQLGVARAPKISLHQKSPRDRRRRVLVADDNPVNLVLATRILENIGIEIVGVGDGAAVLDEVQKNSFDLILMDLQMPKLDGFEAAKAIREAEGTSSFRIPIIALTATDSPRELQRCLDTGMDDYLQKPFRQFELTQKIERYLQMTDVKLFRE